MINSLLVLALTLLRSGVAAQNDASIQRPVPPEAVVTFTTITAKPELFRRQLPGTPLFPGYDGRYTGPAWSSYIATVVDPSSVQSCANIANSIYSAYAQPTVYVTVTTDVCGWSTIYLNTLAGAAATTSSSAAKTTASSFLPTTSAYIPSTVQSTSSRQTTSSSTPTPAATSTTPAAASTTPQPTTSSTSIPMTTSSLHPTTSAPPSTTSVNKAASALSALLTDIPSTALYDDSQFGCFLQGQYGQTTPGWWSTLNGDEQSYLESDFVNTQPCTTSASSAASSLPKPTSASATRASPSLTVSSTPASTSNSLTTVVASQTTLIVTPTPSSSSGGNSGAGLGPLGVSKTPSSTVTATSSPTAAPGGGGGGSNGTKIGAGVGGALGGAAVIASIAFISKLAIQKYFPNKGANPSSAPPNNSLNPPANPNPTNGPHGPNINNGPPQAPNNVGNTGPGPGNPGSGPTNFAPPGNPSSGPMVQMPPGNAPWVMGAGGRLVRQEERRPAPRPVPEGYVAYSGSQETSPTQRYGSPTQSWRSRSSEPLVGDQYLPGGRYEGGNGNGGGGYGRQMPGVGYGGDQGYGGQQQQGYAQQQPLGGYDQQQPQGGYGQQQGAGYGSAVPMPTQQQRRNLEQRAEVEGEMVEASGPRRYA